MGLFKVTIGVMGSSKSSRAIADVKNLRFQGQKVLVIKPSIDDRDGDKISSRLINETIQADIVLSPFDEIQKKSIIENNYDAIVVDELHMLSIKHIEDLYEISAISDAEIHLYGLAMSWKGKPFMTTAIALAYADKIDRIETTDKHKNLLTHHIKKVGNMPCDITLDDSDIDTGDLGTEKYFTVSKQTFYGLYGMLDQINTKTTKTDESSKLDLRDKIYPMVGHIIKLNDLTSFVKLWDGQYNYFSNETDASNMEGYIAIMDKDIFILDVNGRSIRASINDFKIIVDGKEYIPYIDNTAFHDNNGRYL